MRALHFLKHFQAGSSRLGLLLHRAHRLARRAKPFVRFIHSRDGCRTLLFRFLPRCAHIVILLLRLRIFRIELRSLFAERSLFFADGSKAFLQCAADGLVAGKHALRIRNAVHRLDHLALLPFEQCFLFFDVRGHFRKFPALRFKGFPFRNLPVRIAGEFAIARGKAFRKLPAPRLALRNVRLQTLALLQKVLHALLKHAGFARLCFHAGRERKQFILQLADRIRQRALAFFLRRAIRTKAALERRILLDLAGKLRKRIRKAQQPLVEFIVLIQEYVDLNLLQFIPKAQIFACRRALLLERPHLAAELFENVVQALKVFSCAFQLALGIFLAHAVFHHARCLFKGVAALAGLVGKDLLHAALPDDGIPFLADARIPEHLADVLQAAGGTVQKVFALAGAVNAPCHGNLGKIRIQLAVRVVKRQRDFTIGKRLFLFRAVEDDVLHLRAAQSTGALLTQHPAHSVRNVAFSAAVGADDRRDALFKFNLRLPGKGFEPVYFKFYQSQSYIPNLLRFNPLRGSRRIR